MEPFHMYARPAANAFETTIVLIDPALPDGPDNSLLLPRYAVPAWLVLPVPARLDALAGRGDHPLVELIRNMAVTATSAAAAPPPGFRPSPTTLLGRLRAYHTARNCRVETTLYRTPGGTVVEDVTLSRLIPIVFTGPDTITPNTGSSP
jgi:hypothetical protein